MLAADQLYQEYFEPWLRDAGRPDLADAAAQVRQTDVAQGQRWSSSFRQSR